MITKLTALAVIIALMGCCVKAATLENHVFALTIDDTGRLAGLVSKQTGKACYHGRGTLPLGVCAIGDPAPDTVPLRCVSVKEEPGAILCEYTGEGVSCSLAVSADADRPEIIRWKVSAENRGPRRITEIQGPCLDSLRIGSRASDDTLVRPNRYGEKIPFPTRNLFHKAGEMVNGVPYEDWWNTRRLEYGGQAGMFWMDLYDSDGGLYIASEDKTLTGGYLDADVKNGYMALALGKYTDLRQGDSIELDFVTGLHAGDWRWGADTYRRWAYSFMKEPAVPRWVREMPNWYWYSSIWSMGPDKPTLKAAFDFNNVKSDMFDKAVSMGTGVIGLAGQEFMGHDYPLWQPDHLLGSDRVIINAVNDLHRRGGRIVPYINPIYAWEGYPNVPHSDDFQFRYRLKRLPEDILQPDWEHYRQFAAKRYNGAWNNVESHYHGNLPQMCLATKEWQDYVLWWTSRYANYYSFDGVQWDQLGAYQHTYCLDESHGHKVSGCAPEGMAELCRRIFSDPEYKVDSDFYIWYEGTSDICSQYMHAGHAGFDLWMAYGFPEMIQYTFGRSFMGGEYNLLRTMGKEGLIRAKRCIETSFLGRYKLGMGQNREKAFKLEKLAPLTNMLKGVYWYTDYRGSEAVAVPEGVQTSLLAIRQDICPYVTGGGYVIPVCDTRSSKTGFTLSFEGSVPIKHALWFRAGIDPAPQPVEWTQKDGVITVSLPEDTGLNAFSYNQAWCRENRTIASLGLVLLTEQETGCLRLTVPERARRGSPVTIRTCVARDRKVLAEGALSAGNPSPDLEPLETIDGLVTLTR
ncbi:MAG: hypothetical protein IJT95_06905, partial [Abditibacteriota bacterium]|nr:hypothetical protein [Abditibacteriota bacterium]